MTGPKRLRVVVGLAFLGVAGAALMGTSAYRRASRTACRGLDVEPFASKLAAARRAGERSADAKVEGSDPLTPPPVVGPPEEDGANAIAIERDALRSLGTPGSVSRVGKDRGCFDAVAQVVADPSLCERGAAPAAFTGRCRDFVTRRLRYVVITDPSGATVLDLSDGRMRSTTL